jgi:hypothetical protein
MQNEALTDKTHIRCKVILEILGKPKEHVEETIKAYVDKIKSDSELIVLNADFSKADQKEDLWAIFAELEMVIKGIPKLIAFCFDYMPSSVEIIKPSELIMRKSTIEDFTNNLQSKLHNVDMIVKNLKNENYFLKQNMNKAVTNVILISLASKRLDKEKLSEITGINHKELSLFLDELLKKNKIVEDQGYFSLVLKNA